MQLIYCHFNMFDAQQVIFKVNENGEVKSIVTIDSTELSSVIPTVCQKEEIYDVHLFGNQDYLKNVAMEAIALNKNLYKENAKEINIEVFSQ